MIEMIESNMYMVTWYVMLYLSLSFTILW